MHGPVSRRFRHRFRVRWAEVDPQKIVFNARYLDYADVVITEYWEAARAFRAWPDDFEVHVARAEVDYRQPFRAREVIVGEAWTSRLGNSSVTTSIRLLDEGGALRTAIELIQVHVDLSDGRPRPLPDWFRQAMTDFDASCQEGVGA